MNHPSCLESLIMKALRPLDERRQILEQNMTEIPGRIMFSDQKTVKKSSDLREMILNVIQEGLEGLVLKDSKVY